jgi:hypothetical protein
MAITFDRHRRRGSLGATRQTWAAGGTPSTLVREYLSAEQLADLTPWTTNAIEKMVRRGLLQRGVHFFQPFGHRTQLLFKWNAIVELIEGESPKQKTSAAPDLLLKGPLDVAKATEDLSGLLRR